jgi:hypothetical protein
MLVNYEGNIDYQATWEKMLATKVITVDRTQKGILSARFLGTKTVFMISPAGNLQAYWHDINEKQILFECLQALLVAKDGQELNITPKNQVCKINYSDSKLSLFWCAEKQEYFKNYPIVVNGGEVETLEWGYSTGGLQGAIDFMERRGFKYSSKGLWTK